MYSDKSVISALSSGYVGNVGAGKGVGDVVISGETVSLSISDADGVPAQAVKDKSITHDRTNDIIFFIIFLPFVINNYLTDSPFLNQKHFPFSKSP